MGLFKKADIEMSLQQEQKMIQEGKLKEDNPLDLSDTFWRLCEACRRGDLKVCQEMITEGANINARDQFDYTPLILASLCGHFEVVRLLLESGALCERDTFQGERCLYNALNDRIRNLLLSYDYSKSTDPLQPFAAHITSLLARDHPRTSDLLVVAADESFHLHKFILSARSPYFSRKLATAPETTSWKLPASIPVQAFNIAIRYLYFEETPNDVGGGPGTGFAEELVLEGLDKITKQLEVRSLWDGILEAGDRRLARQRHSDEVNRGRNQLAGWFGNNVLKHKIMVESHKAGQVRWDRENAIFADVLLQADEADEEFGDENKNIQNACPVASSQRAASDGIPIGPLGLASSRSPSRHRSPRKSTLFPVHRAMLLRSEYFSVMFSSGFREAQETEYLQIIPIDCSPDVLEIVLTFLYTEKTDFPLELAIDVLFVADLLLIDKLKMKAAVVISTLGNGSMVRTPARLDAAGTTNGQGAVDHPESQPPQDELDIYDVIRAGWLTRMPRLEEFGARYIAQRLESYIDEEAFADLVRESASRIRSRHETDTIELLDDIRYYLSERFRLRFEDAGIEEMIEEEEAAAAAAAAAAAVAADATAKQKHTSFSTINDNSERDSPASLKSPSTLVPDRPLTAAATSSVPADTTTAQSPPSRSMDSVVPPPQDTTDRQPVFENENAGMATVIRTLDGEIAGDEMEEEAMNYQILLGKIDALLDRLKLDA